MAATLISTIVTVVRDRLNDPSDAGNPDPNWSDSNLVSLANTGIKDLWRAINDLFNEYFVTVDDTHVTLPANSSTLAGVPADVFRIVAIEPRVVGSSNPNAGIIFKPRKYTHPDFQKTRAMDAQAPQQTILFYDVMNAGAPIGAPTIMVAPQITSAMNVRLVYNQTLPDVTLTDPNPIPGESNNALIAWMVAYARSNERDDRAPDPEWLAVYSTEKTNLTKQLTPRSIQEPEVVEGLFEDLWPDWN